LKGEPARFQTETGVLLEEVARCTAERSRIGPAPLGKLKRKIEEAGIFGRGEPSAGLAARCSQIQKDLLRVVTGILRDDRPERREAG
jgi:hypothetical protein